MSRCPGLYFDIGKEARDVIHEDNAKQPPIHFYYQFLDWNLDLSCQVAEIVPGLRSLFNFTAPDSGKVRMNDHSGITGCIGLIGNPLKGYDPVVNFSGLIGASVIALGTNLAFNISKRKIHQFNAGLSFNSAFLIASLTLHDKLDTLKASIYHAVNPLTKSAFAAEVNHSFSRSETGITVGAQHELHPCTVVKARMDTNGKVGALIQQELWQRFFLSIAGEVDLRATCRLPKIGASMALVP